MPRAWLTACSCLVLAGCGGGHTAAPRTEPRLPRPLATALAARSTAVAAALRRGDGCRARTEANALRNEAVTAMNEGRVPHALQEELQSAVNDLADRIRCTPSAPQPQPQARGHGRKKGDEMKHEEGGD